MKSGVELDLSPGAIFADRYRVVRCMRSGGMGALYETVHLETARSCALKVMLPSLVSDPVSRGRFRLEATVAANIGSEHIVEVFDAGVDAASGAPYLVMELLRGEDLGTILRAGPLAAAEVHTLLFQAALALEKTHAAGVVHRDLKPDNLFLTERDDGTPRLKILDFGIAKVVAKDIESAQRTATIGTPLYMAPEQIHGGTIGPAADLYALGQLAYAMATGAAYWGDGWDGGAIYKLLLDVANGVREPASVRAARAGVLLPPAFDAWFAKATALIPEQRFEGARAMVQALAEALELTTRSPSRRGSAHSSGSYASGASSSGPYASGASSSGPYASGASSSGEVLPVSSGEYVLDPATAAPELRGAREDLDWTAGARPSHRAGISAPQGTSPLDELVGDEEDTNALLRSGARPFSEEPETNALLRSGARPFSEEPETNALLRSGARPFSGDPEATALLESGERQVPAFVPQAHVPTGHPGAHPASAPWAVAQRADPLRLLTPSVAVTGAPWGPAPRRSLAGVVASAVITGLGIALLVVYLAWPSGGGGEEGGTRSNAAISPTTDDAAADGEAPSATLTEDARFGAAASASSADASDRGDVGTRANAEAARDFDTGAAAASAAPSTSAPPPGTRPPGGRKPWRGGSPDPVGTSFY